MKKVCLILALVFCVSFASALTAVVPASYEIDFEPNAEEQVEFNFVFDEGAESEIYVSGDLAEYVTTDIKILRGSGRVTATIKLPFSVESGTHRLIVGARQVADENGGFETLSDVRGVVKIKVPYPGMFLETKMIVESSNINETVNYDLEFWNAGEGVLNAVPVLKVLVLNGHDSGEPKNGDEVDVIELDEVILGVTEGKKISGGFLAEGYSRGDYVLRLEIDYGGEELAVVEREFRLGEKFIEIVNYTSEVERDMVNRFLIDVVSHWNNDVKDLSATIEVLEDGVEVSKTPSIKLVRFEETVLEGFLDTTEIGPTKFDVKITLDYDGGVSEEIVRVKFAGEISSYWYFIIGGGLALIVALVYIWFRRRKK